MKIHGTDVNKKTVKTGFNGPKSTLGQKISQRCCKVSDGNRVKG
jgi:hypothetical protein